VTPHIPLTQRQSTCLSKAEKRVFEASKDTDGAAAGRTPSLPARSLDPVSLECLSLNELRSANTRLFLGSLFQNAPAASLIEYRLIASRPGDALPMSSFIPAEDENVLLRLESYLDANVTMPSALFFGVNPRKRHGGTRDDVAAVVALVVDLDGKEIGLDEQWLRVHRLATSIPIFAIVASGSPGHTHLYFRLGDAERRFDFVDAVNRRLEGYLGADRADALSRTPRLPGSVNWKSGTPVLTHALIDPSANTTLEQVNAALDLLGAPPAEERRTDTSRRLSFDRKSHVDQARVEAIWRALPTWAQELISKGHIPGNRYRSRSEGDAAAIRALVDVGAADPEIAHLFTQSPIGEKYRESGDAYLSRTIAFVRGSAADALVRVKGVDPGPQGGRAILDLEVVSGNQTGLRLKQGVESSSSVWPWLFRSAGLPAAPSGANAIAVQLIGSILRVRLESINWCGKPRYQVKRFLPPLVF